LFHKFGKHPHLIGLLPLLRHMAEDTFSDLKERIRKELDGLDFMNDPEATDKQEELTAMSVLRHMAEDTFSLGTPFPIRDHFAFIGVDVFLADRITLQFFGRKGV